MHPVNSNNFGTLGISVVFNNGISTVHGYIVKQTGVTRYKVSDGVNEVTATLAKNTAELNHGTFAPGIMTIMINGSEHVSRLDSKVAYTIEGHRYTWSLDGAAHGAANIPSCATVRYP